VSSMFSSLFQNTFVDLAMPVDYPDSIIFD
jgi:hypothetical protein